MPPTMAVGGTVGGRSSNAMRDKSVQPVLIRSFAVAVYLRGKGHRVLDATLSQDGLAGEVVFRFGPEAAPAMAEYFADKEELSRLMTETRRQR